MTTEITTKFSVDGLSREQSFELVKEIELAVMLKTGQRVGIHSVITTPSVRECNRVNDMDSWIQETKNRKAFLEFQRRVVKGINKHL